MIECLLSKSYVVTEGLLVIRQRYAYILSISSSEIKAGLFHSLDLVLGLRTLTRPSRYSQRADDSRRKSPHELGRGGNPLHDNASELSASRLTPRNVFISLGVIFWPVDLTLV